MKRFVALFLAIVLILGISACSPRFRGSTMLVDPDRNTGGYTDEYTDGDAGGVDTYEPQNALLLEEVVEGFWMAQVDWSQSINMMIEQGMDEINERLDDDRPDLTLSAVSNLNIAFSFSFQQGRADMKCYLSKDFEATLLDAWKDDLGKWIDTYYAQKGEILTEEVREVEIAHAMWQILEIIEIEPSDMEDGEPIMTDEMYTILGNILYIDDIQIGTLTVVDENTLTLEVYVEDGYSSTIESSGVSTTWTLNRVSDESLDTGKAVGNANDGTARPTGLERWYLVQNAQQDPPHGIARFTINSDGLAEIEVIRRDQETGEFNYNVTQCTTAESENGVGFSFHGTWLIQGDTVLYQQWVWSNGKSPYGGFYTPPSNEESVSWYEGAMRYYNSIK